jgi:hypothetical protein
MTLVYDLGELIRRGEVGLLPGEFRLLQPERAALEHEDQGSKN